MKKLMKSVLACALAFAMVLTVMPVNSYAASDKKVVVTSQKQLEKALKSGATNIVIKTDKKIKITIPASKKAEKVSISVQAKNATITNNATVKSIVIKDAKAFVESGKNNDIKITDSKLSLTVAKESKGADIKVAKKDAEIKVVAKGDVASVTVAKTAEVKISVAKTATVDSVNVAAKGAEVDVNAKGTISDVNVSKKAADTKLNIKASGKVENVQIDAKADVAVAGTTKEAVKVTVNAKDTTIKAETAVDTTLNADAKVDLSKGAEGSKVTTAENVKADVANNTADKVTVTDSTGKETSVDAGKTETTKDESKKDDEKKDDQKKDDQSSGGSSGGSSGTVTPTPTPSEQDGKLYRIYVEDTNLISVYLDDVDEVSTEFNSGNVVITDSNGTRIPVKQAEADDNGYYLTLEKDMEDGKYSLTMRYDGKKYVGEYTYNKTTIEKLKEQMEQMKKKVEGETITVSETALTSPILYSDALLKFYENDMSGFFTKDFSISYDEIKDGKPEVMWISLENFNKESNIYYYYEESVNVSFACTGEAFEAHTPEIKAVLKNSVVVKNEEDYEYACVVKGTDISSVSDDDWISENINDSKYIELTGLEKDKSYTVYGRYSGDSKLSKSTEVTRTEQDKETLCIAENKEDDVKVIEKGVVSAGSKISFPAKVDVYSFGKYDDDALSGDIEFACENKEINYFLENSEWDMRSSDDDGNPIISFTVPRGFKAGEYEVKINYLFVCHEVLENGEWGNHLVARSNPITYTVKFICKPDETITAQKPVTESAINIKNSIIIKTEPDFEYACVDQGTSIIDIPEDSWKYDSDEFGRIEFSNLESGKTYTVYSRWNEDASVYDSLDVTVSTDGDTILCAAESADGKLTPDLGTVKAGQTLRFLAKVKCAAYGNFDREGLQGNVSLSNDKYIYQSDRITDLNVREIGEDRNPFIEFTVGENLEAGTYTETIYYYFECNRVDEIGNMTEERIARSEPVTYTVVLASN